MNYLDMIKIEKNKFKEDKLSKRVLKVITLTLVILWCIVIFYLSHQNSSVSSRNSLDIIKFITDNVFNKDINMLNTINEMFRTFMHGFVYFILSFLTLTYLKIWNKYNILNSIIFTFIYSITDEVHQYYIPGRAFQFSDIVVDFIGNIIGVMVFILVSKLLYYILNKFNIYRN